MESAAFPRSARVRHHGSFAAVQALGHKIVTRHLVFLVGPNGERTPRLGLIVSRKVGNAVVRNRIKRITREVFRQTHPLPGLGVDILVIPRFGLPVPAPYDAINECFSGFVREYARRYGNQPPQCVDPRAREKRPAKAAKAQPFKRDE